MASRRPRKRTPPSRRLRHGRTLAEEIDVTLIEWFLTLSPWERLQASANWARLATFRRAKSEDD